MSIIESVKNTAFTVAVNTVLNYLEKEPETNIPKAMNLIDKALPDGWYESQRAAFRKAIAEKGNWYELILKAYQLDTGVRKTLFQNFIINSALKGGAVQEEMRKKENCNIPWAVLLDPTSACNLHCTGCWAAEYGHKLNLSLETIDSIIRQGKDMGVYMYIYTGGEPMVRKNDLITLCERHPDCAFLSFTNGTLIDEAFCKEMLRVKNFVPAISLEGFEQANDGRRGNGVFEKVMQAMNLLREHKLPFGISTCYTSANYADISSEQFFDMMIDMGCLSGSSTICPLAMSCTSTFAHAGAEKNRLRTYPRFSEHKADFQHGFPERCRVCRRLYCRRPEIISTSMLPGMWSLVCSSIIPM